MKENGIINKIYDNSAENDKGVFGSIFTIDLVNGTRLYCRESLNPIPSSGDKIGYDVINRKTSAQGNPYTNVQNLLILGEGEGVNKTQPAPTTNGNKSENNKDRLIYVTGIVGRAMSSGNFSELKISALTEEAVKSFNKHLG